jgi:CRISPR/Cas system CSM-associated protein Csm3 (group 7 of RAMP superfamily)
VRIQLRAGVGIKQKTGARASGILYDREVVPAGTRWPVVFRVDWSFAGDEAAEAEGILGYVLFNHWTEDRCWLGGDVARGLGWCHIEDLSAHRLDEAAYETWVASGRTILPEARESIPERKPTKSWCFMTRDVQIDFGEYRPNGENEPTWGLDMFAVGSHSADQGLQSPGAGMWARPFWVDGAMVQDELATDRALLMERDRPLLPGSSIRGPLRHVFSRAARMLDPALKDPHDVQGDVGESDAAGKIFGTVARSSRVLIRDGVALDSWAAARLHMHAEDEFSAGSYGTAKRDAVRMLRGSFPVRIVVEGPDLGTVAGLTCQLDKLIDIGRLRHLAIGGHKTRGAGWGSWRASKWEEVMVTGQEERRTLKRPADAETMAGPRVLRKTFPRADSNQLKPTTAWVQVDEGALGGDQMTLLSAGTAARQKFGDDGREFVAWWCEPTIDLTAVKAPPVFGWNWPILGSVSVDEVMFFFKRACWHAARKADGIRWVAIQEIGPNDNTGEAVDVFKIPARLHGDTTRFAANLDPAAPVIVREWRSKSWKCAPLGFTLDKGGE